MRATHVVCATYVSARLPHADWDFGRGKQLLLPYTIAIIRPKPSHKWPKLSNKKKVYKVFDQQPLGEFARQYWHVSQLVERAICRPISWLKIFEIIERIFVFNIRNKYTTKIVTISFYFCAAIKIFLPRLKNWSKVCATFANLAANIAEPQPLGLWQIKGKTIFA